MTMGEVNQDRLFVVAARNKYRFTLRGSKGPSGEVMAEDLFDLSVEQLNALGKAYKALLSSNQDDWLDETSKEEQVVSNKLQIIKYVFDYKEQRRIAAEKAALTRAQSQRLLELKQEAELRNVASMRPEEIDALIQEVQKEQSEVDALAI